MSSEMNSGEGSGGESGVDAAIAMSALWDGELSPTELDVLLAAMSESPDLAQRWERMSATQAALEGVAFAHRGELDFASSIMARLADESAPDALTADHESAQMAGGKLAGSNVVQFPRRETHKESKESEVTRVVVAPAAASAQTAKMPTRRALRPAFGWAAAASVAMVMVVASQVGRDLATPVSVAKLDALVANPGAVNVNNTAASIAAATQLASAESAHSAQAANVNAAVESANSDLTQASTKVRSIPVSAESAPTVVAMAGRGATSAYGRGDAVYFSVSPSGQLVPTVIKETALSQVDPESTRTLDDYLIEHSSYRVGSGFGGSLGYARFAAHTAELRTGSGAR